ncbi:T6SS immunity protein Tli4 family protein [Geobacter sp.]|uniref:T6SS immunity protein Tli4 family protein n=1 Tax=Geobacter sp. TaxID=46610 RepID=UPI00260C64C9|nr:T6SS immunity protein Tli4 family protein [Geobacter sp.]
MKTYYMGRFAVDVPAEFKLAVQSHRFRLIEIEEYPEVQDAEKKWRDYLATIERMRKPEGVKRIIIKEQKIDGMGRWAKGVLYYSDYMADDECNWDIFVSYGNSAALFQLKGLLGKEHSMLVWLQEVARAYRPESAGRTGKGRQFHTEHGVIELPYKRQESTYARFAGPNGMVLKIEMDEIHKASEKEGIIDRTVAAMATGFAAGLDIKKIRSQKRTAAGLPGEEEILQGDDGKRKNVSFDWEYLGRVDSGEHPKIQISIDTMADNLEEKVRIWDKVLDSFRPVYQ